MGKLYSQNWKNVVKYIKKKILEEEISHDRYFSDRVTTKTILLEKFLFHMIDILQLK